MTPEEIRRALSSASELNDQFYKTLAPVMTNWTAVYNAAAAAIPEGTTRDVTAIAANISRGNDGLYELIDASIYLGQCLNTLAVQF